MGIKLASSRELFAFKIALDKVANIQTMTCWEEDVDVYEDREGYVSVAYVKTYRDIRDIERGTSHMHKFHLLVRGVVQDV